jgi:hypothetical protein
VKRPEWCRRLEPDKHRTRRCFRITHSVLIDGVRGGGGQPGPEGERHEARPSGAEAAVGEPTWWHGRAAALARHGGEERDLRDPPHAGEGGEHPGPRHRRGPRRAGLAIETRSACVTDLSGDQVYVLIEDPTPSAETDLVFE